MIAVDHITVFLGGRPILQDFSLNVGSGQCVELIGSSELGKSTLLKNLVGELMGPRQLKFNALPRQRTTDPSSLPGCSAGEIANISANENVRRLADLLLRRTAIIMEGLLSEEAVKETAKIIADTPGWDKASTMAEIELVKTELARRSVKNVRPAQTLSRAPIIRAQAYSKVTIGAANLLAMVTLPPLPQQYSSPTRVSHLKS